MPLDALTFDNRFRAGLPGEAEPRPGVRPVAGAWSAVAPTPVAAPRVIAHSREIAAQLGLTGADVADPAFAAVFGGNALLQGMAPWAANYGGHQFGHWAGQLGDGRAISLGEALGVDGQRLELQLKGAGPTPFSRGADGRAVLRSSVREFLCSEAMHHLGVPTTRALSLVATGDDVVRDMFYDGRPAPEPGAIVCRVAPSFIRFGTFELPASRGDRDLLQDLVEFTISRDFPHLSGDGEALYAAWFADVCTRTATLMAHWMRVGFVHGVMNTDNLSILGLTIDYGPYGWLEDYDPDWTPNTTDAQGRRYRYAWQPRVAHWNLGRLAQALSPLFATAAPLQAALDGYAAAYAVAEADTIARKLGFATFREDDRALMDALQALLHDGEVDMTLWFRALGETDPAAPDMTMFDDAFYDAAKQAATASAFADWMALYAARTAADGHDAATRRAVMRAANPKYVLRNWLAQEAIDRAAAGDDDGITALLEVLRRPYEDQPGREAFARRRPEWARVRAGCSMLSCSS